MNKKLPNIFVNKNTGIIKNNEEFYYGKDNLNETKIIDDNMKEILIRKKINDIFSINNFIYKVNVCVTTKNGDKDYTLIARDKTKLLTINNEVIDIKDIIDIKLVK